MIDGNKLVLIKMAIKRIAGFHEKLGQIAKGNEVLMDGLSEEEEILVQHLARKRLIEWHCDNLQLKEEKGQLQLPTIAYKEKLISEKHAIEDWADGKREHPTTWDREVLDKFQSNDLKERKKVLEAHNISYRQSASSDQQTDQGFTKTNFSQQTVNVHFTNQHNIRTIIQNIDNKVSINAPITNNNVVFGQVGIPGENEECLRPGHHENQPAPTPSDKLSAKMVPDPNIKGGLEEGKEKICSLYGVKEESYDNTVARKAKKYEKPIFHLNGDNGPPSMYRDDIIFLKGTKNLRRPKK